MDPSPVASLATTLWVLEKQKLRYFYGLLERQFRNVYERALRMRGVTGEKMLQILETRLDSLVFQAGFGVTRAKPASSSRTDTSGSTDERCPLPASP